MMPGSTPHTMAVEECVQEVVNGFTEAGIQTAPAEVSCSESDEDTDKPFVKTNMIGFIPTTVGKPILTGCGIDFYVFK